MGLKLLQFPLMMEMRKNWLLVGRAYAKISYSFAERGEIWLRKNFRTFLKMFYKNAIFDYKESKLRKTNNELIIKQ